MAVIRVYGFCEEGKGIRVLQQVMFCRWDLGLGSVGWVGANRIPVGWVSFEPKGSNGLTRLAYYFFGFYLFFYGKQINKAP